MHVDSGASDTHSLKRNYHKGDYEIPSHLFNSVQWEEELTQKTVEEAWSTFLKHYNNVVQICIPFVPTTFNGGQPKPNECLKYDQ